jgi:hypothetical protein
MTELATNRLPLRKPEVWLRQSGSENVVFDPVSGRAHVLNATAVAIWALCDGETRPSEMIDAVCSLSKLPVEIVAEDVFRILSEFEAAEIMSWND